MKIIENVKFMQDGTMVFGDIYFENGFIERIDYKTPHMVSDIAIPGFVDIHTHGFRGYSCDDCDSDNLKALAMEFPKRGVTSFCATISARSLEEYANIIAAYKNVFNGDYKGARFEGFHLEGPYLNPDKCSFMKKEDLQEIHIGKLEAFLSKYHNDIKVMTIAPELKNAEEAIQLLHLYGVEISLGHTNATYEETKNAFDLGATLITHLGNAMPEITHKHATMLDAVFLSSCRCEVIMDGVHIQAQMLQWLIRLLGSERIIAVSDGTKYSGFTYPSSYHLNNGHEVLNGAIYQGDMLLGSCKDLLDIFQFLYKDLHYDLIDCIRMCSTNAAKVCTTYTREIGLGKRVDLVILDHDMNIKDAIINGKSVL